MAQRYAFGLALLALGLVFGPATALEGDELWQHAYGGEEQDWGRDMKVTDDRGFVLTGYTTSFGVSGRDVYLVKLDAAGAVQWETPLGSAANDDAQAVIQTSDGGYLVAGNLNIGSSITKQGLLIKVDASGVEQWSETYGGSEQDEFFDVIECSTGGYAMAGVTASSGPGAMAAWLVRVDAAGELQWESAVALDGHADVLTGLVETADGHFVASGYSSDGNTFPEYDAELAAFSATGSLIWNRTFDHSFYDRAYDIALAGEDGFVLTGPSASAMTIWRTDTSGNLDWFHRFNTVTGDYGLAVIATSDRGFLAGGQTYDYDEQYQMFVGKTDASGNELWVRQYGSAANESCQAVAETPTGDYAIFGTTNFYDSPDDNLLLITLEGPQETTPVDNTPLATNLDGSLTAFPNPFNPLTTIAFALAEPAAAKVIITDVNGRRVRTLLDGETLAAGEQTLRWDGRDGDGRRLGSGVYFARLRVGDEVAGEKLVLIK